MFDTTRKTGARLWAVGAAALLALAAAILALSAVPGPAEAAKSGTCRAFSVTAGGQTFRGDQDRNIRVGETIRVNGTFVDFRVVSDTFAVEDYRLTSPINGGQTATIFESKVPLHGETLAGRVSLDISNEGVVLRRSGGGQDMKIQAKDCPQGGLFQMEPEPGTRERNTLGPGFTYENGTPGQDGPLCFANGRFPGYDSPEVATLIDNTAKVATWRVAAGGRIGMVIGEDAVEGGCTA